MSCPWPLQIPHLQTRPFLPLPKLSPQLSEFPFASPAARISYLSSRSIPVVIPVVGVSLCLTCEVLLFFFHLIPVVIPVVEVFLCLICKVLLILLLFVLLLPKKGLGWSTRTFHRHRHVCCSCLPGAPKNALLRSEQRGCNAGRCACTHARWTDASDHLQPLITSASTATATATATASLACNDSSHNPPCTHSFVTILGLMDIWCAGSWDQRFFVLDLSIIGPKFLSLLLIFPCVLVEHIVLLQRILSWTFTFLSHFACLSWSGAAPLQCLIDASNSVCAC
jgi:hypothetical protein